MRAPRPREYHRQRSCSKHDLPWRSRAIDELANVDIISGSRAVAWTGGAKAPLPGSRGTGRMASPKQKSAFECTRIHFKLFQTSEGRPLPTCAGYVGASTIPAKSDPRTRPARAADGLETILQTRLESNLPYADPAN